MNLGRAVDQIEQIHRQLARSDIYRGYRPVPVAASGAIGLIAAWLQPPSLGSGETLRFVQYWSAIAAAAAVVGFSEIVFSYVREAPATRRRTRQVIGQFLPALVAGAIVAIALSQPGRSMIDVLPGVWALCFGVGIVSSRPYLPVGSGTVATFYMAAGAALLWLPHAAAARWAVGGTFGIGQLLAAGVLWRDDYSNQHGEKNTLA